MIELHTPSPWFKGKQSDSGWHTIRVTDTGCTHGRIIAEVLEPEDCPIITAAPDLLAALIELLEEVDFEIEQRKYSGNDEDWRALETKANRARAAIAKAEGRE